MKLLVLGGNVFLGREVAAQAIAHGDSVTCLVRGRSGSVPRGAGLVLADRDHRDGLAVVADERWDAVLDVSRQPGQVRRALADLDAGHFVFMSTCNVYADTVTPGLAEDAELLDPLVGEVLSDMSRYGSAKVACEQAVEGFDSHTIVRAGLIGGSGDLSGRSGYWPWRFARAEASPVLVPAELDQPGQLLDVRDVASWLLRCARESIRGTFNATGHPTTLGGLLTAARTATGHIGELRAVPSGWLHDHDVNTWMGPRSLPLWLDGPDWRGFLSHSNERARSQGLLLRDPVETFAAAGQWEATRGRSASGLSDAEHDELLREAATDGW